MGSEMCIRDSYKKETGEIRLNYNTTDSKGDFYYTY